MENKKVYQESAFPVNDDKVGNWGLHESGMSKRFYAACAAMQGLCAVNDKGEFKDMDAFYERIVMHAYKIADVMLKQEK